MTEENYSKNYPHSLLVNFILTLTLGTVQFVDDADTIHVGRENSSSLGLVPGEYQFTKVRKREYER